MKRSWKVAFVIWFILIFTILFFNSQLTGFFVGDFSVGVDEGIKVIYSEFSGEDSTTGFLFLNDTQLEEIDEVTITTEFGRIIFNDTDAIFASESDFEKKLKNIKSIDGIIIISASGGKHAPIIAKCSKKYNKHVTLITTNKNAPALLADALKEYFYLLVYRESKRRI